MRRLVVPALVAVATLALLLTAWSADPDPGDPTGRPDPEAVPTPAAAPPPDPPAGRCHDLAFGEALAPSTPAHQARPCRRPHTAETYLVEQLDLVVAGHQLTVDSDRVQRQAARRCPSALPAFLGASADVVRLGMVQPVWFTPTLEQSDAGAEWLRCDAVVVGGERRLVQVSGSLQGAYREGLPARYAMCGTAAPDAATFERVVCSEDHSWRAVSVVRFETRDYPGRGAARSRGQGTCEDVGADHADDPLDYRWSYEWPTREQWQGGMTFGRCWVPDNG